MIQNRKSQCIAQIFMVFASSMVVSKSLDADSYSNKNDADPALIFECDFDSSDWWKEWSLRQSPKRVQTVDSDEALRFDPKTGNALKIRVDAGGHYGLSLEFPFKERTGEEPEKVYFRYYIRLADDWNPERGGKFPGIAGTYGRAGWGGRPVDGTDGWSARGLFGGQKDGITPVGFYVYHAKMNGKYGDNWFWSLNDFEGLENNRWYCIEQFVQMNTPGKDNGVLKAWVDDELVFEKSDVRMRETASLKIENVWINLYYGGSWTSKDDQHLYIDDVAISKERIGK